MKGWSKQEVINELSKLYALQREGKKVKVLIAEYEELLYRLTDEEMDETEDDEKDTKGW